MYAELVESISLDKIQKNCFGPSSDLHREIHVLHLDGNHFELLIPSVWYLTGLSQVEGQDPLTALGRSLRSSADPGSDRGELASSGLEFPFFKSFFDYLIRSNIVRLSSRTHSQKMSGCHDQSGFPRPQLHPMTSFIRILNSGTFTRQKKPRPSDLTPTRPIRNIKLGHQVSDAPGSQTRPNQITSSTSFLRINNVLAVVTPRNLNEKSEESSIFSPYNVVETYATGLAKDQLTFCFLEAQPPNSISRN